MPSATRRQRLEDVLDAPEQLTPGARRLAAATFGSRRGDESPHFLAIGLGLGDEFRKGGVAFLDQPVAPAFRAAESGRVETGRIGIGIECRLDRVEIDSAHQLGDELPLSHQGAPRRDPSGERDGVAEFLRESQAVDEFRRRIDQAVGQCLDGLCLSLQFTLGRRRDATGQLTAAHGSMLAGTIP